MTPHWPDERSYREHVRSEVEHLADGLTRVLFGDYDTVLRARSADPLFGNLAMLGNVVINSARNAIADQQLQADAERQRARELEEERARLAAILEASQDGIVMFDGSELVSYASESFCELTGLAAERLRGSSVPAVLEQLRGTQPRPTTGFERPFEVRRERAFSLVRIQHPEARSLRVIGGPVYDAAGGTIGHLVVFRDVTFFDQSRQFRDQLLGNLAHEVRTPLTSIQGFSQLLANGSLGSLTPEQAQVARTILGSTERLARLLDDLLSVDRLESGRVHLVRFDLAPLLHEIVGSLRPAAEAKGLTLELALPGGALPVRADSGTLGQAIRNLVSNAIKYTFTGQVAVSVRARDDRRLEIDVSDTGIGLSAESLKRLFDRYFRAHDPSSQGVDGTGLGLSIVQQFVHLNGGEIAVQSELGRGSKFAVILPIAD